MMDAIRGSFVLWIKKFESLLAVLPCGKAKPRQSGVAGALRVKAEGEMCLQTIQRLRLTNVPMLLSPAKWCKKRKTSAQRPRFLLPLRSQTSFKNGRAPAIAPQLTEG
jgi:hypothetical protein